MVGEMQGAKIDIRHGRVCREDIRSRSTRVDREARAVGIPNTVEVARVELNALESDAPEASRCVDNRHAGDGGALPFRSPADRAGEEEHEAVSVARGRERFRQARPAAEDLAGARIDEHGSFPYQRGDEQARASHASASAAPPVSTFRTTFIVSRSTMRIPTRPLRPGAEMPRASSERSGDRLQALWYSPSRTCRDTGLSEMGSRRARLTAVFGVANIPRSASVGAAVATPDDAAGARAQASTGGRAEPPQEAQPTMAAAWCSGGQGDALGR
jgi:hypothetical protein